MRASRLRTHSHLRAVLTWQLTCCAPAVAALAPEGHTVRAATSTLAKLLTWQARAGGLPAGAVLAHQADFIAAQLHGQHGVRRH